MKKYLLGVDLGTTNVKAMLFSEDGNCAAKGEAGNYRTISEHFNRAEQDPNVWWQDTVFSIGKVTSQISWTDSEIAAICVSSQGMAMLPLDEQGNPYPLLYMRR